MSVLISLDPGLHACGVALWRDGQLARCDLVKSPVLKGNDGEAMRSMVRAVAAWTMVNYTQVVSVDACVVEFPRIYQRVANKSKGDPNDLTPLAGIAIGVLVKLDPTTAVRVFPSEWKGQMPEDATTSRVRSRLDLFEAQCLKNAEERAKSLAHNVVDAVGIGLWALGRFDRRRVIPR